MINKSSIYLTTLASMYLAGCSNSGFEFKDASKMEAISKSSVFGDAEGITPVGGDGTTSNIPPIGGDGSGLRIKFGVNFTCSDAYTKTKKGLTLQSVADVNVIVALNSKAVCTLNNQKSNILSTKTVDLSSCPDFDKKETYQVQVVDAAANLQNLSQLAPTETLLLDRFEFDFGRDGKVQTNSKISLLLDENPDSDIIKSDSSLRNPLCDQLYSPLVINMTPASKKDRSIMLTSPQKGIKFDILGENQKIAHEKSQISWIRNSYYMFLTLPNASGQVKGINELFGDNTRGPDGLFSRDGYRALAKYDDNGDGFIDANDAIFSALRLWSDRNFDGESQLHELYSLEFSQIKSIDLKYDPNFFEQDKYGNQSRLKSVVERNNGHKNVIFDLWFIVR